MKMTPHSNVVVQEKSSILAIKKLRLWIDMIYIQGVT